ncbi:MAG: thiol:disulfide interchange protein DsbG [Rhodanobacter sp.]|nr:MAG: thiol:disulfide interchange protein DsbG [Rhodanobacter sp.]
MKSRLVLALAAVGGLLGAPAWAATAPAQPAVSVAQAQQLVGSASHGAARVVRVFAGPDGMVGAVIEPSEGGAQQVVWLTPHAQALVTGNNFYDAEGNSLTYQAMLAQGLMTSPAATLTAAAAPASRPILLGSKGPILTELFDPNCIYCHELYQALKPAIAAGQLRVRYVLVGVVKPSSLPRAAAILAAKDPAAALAQDEARFDVKDEEGGYPPDKTMDAAAKAVVDANNALFDKMGASGTPTLLYCATGQKDVQTLGGMPKDVAGFVAQLASGPARECGAK